MFVLLNDIDKRFNFPWISFDVIWYYSLHGNTIISYFTQSKELVWNCIWCLAVRNEIEIRIDKQAQVENEFHLSIHIYFLHLEPWLVNL